MPDKKENAEWEQTPEEEQERDFLSTKHSSLRKLPGYEKFVIGENDALPGLILDTESQVKDYR